MKVLDGNRPWPVAPGEMGRTDEGGGVGLPEGRVKLVLRNEV